MLWKIFCAAAALFCFGCRSRSDVPAVEKLDPVRYMGKWYEIARLPNWFERGMSDVYALYTLMDDGRIKVVNCGMKAGKLKQTEGIARFKDPAVRNGELEVSFFPPFYGDYRIIKLAEDYSYSVVAGGGRSYLWILAREREISPAIMAEIDEFLKRNGYQVEKLVK